MSLRCSRSPRFGYRCYVPKSFDSRRRGIRVIVHFSPSGRAEPLARDFAERTGWISVGLTESKNGPWAPIADNRDAAIADLRDRLSPPVGSKWLVFAGFSGGARASALAAEWYSGETAGAISMNAGLQGLPIRRSIAKWVPICFVEGDGDMNRAEAKGDFDAETQRGRATRYVSFNGGHTMPPAAKIAESLRWIAEQSPLAPARRGVLSARRPDLRDERLFATTNASSVLNGSLRASADGRTVGWIETQGKLQRAVFQGKAGPWHGFLNAEDRLPPSSIGVAGSGKGWWYVAGQPSAGLYKNGERIPTSLGPTTGAMSDDGRHFAYSTARFGADGFEAAEVYVEGRRVDPPLANLRRAGPMVYSPDGQHLAYKAWAGPRKDEYVVLDGKPYGPYRLVTSRLSFGGRPNDSFLLGAGGEILRTAWEASLGRNRYVFVNGRQDVRVETNMGASWTVLPEPFVDAEGKVQAYVAVDHPSGRRSDDRFSFVVNSRSFPTDRQGSLARAKGGAFAWMAPSADDDRETSDGLRDLFVAGERIGTFVDSGSYLFDDEQDVAIDPSGSRVANPVMYPGLDTDVGYLTIVCGTFYSELFDHLRDLRFTDDGHLVATVSYHGRWYLWVDGWRSAPYDAILERSKGDALASLVSVGVRRGTAYRIHVHG